MDGSGTIAAISTPAGEGGIGIIRISGPDAPAVAGRIFRTHCGSSIAEIPSHSLRHGRVHHPGGELLDEALLAVFRAPRSYTGEDTVEIHCHGGLATTSAVLEAALAAGARLAEPGEFTRRAFLNGRIDLVQAEAVIELIRARTEAARKAALLELGGEFSRAVRALRRELLELAGTIESALDFEEDEVEGITPEAAAALLGNLASGISGLLEATREGALYQEGIRAVIAGRPNVGKSSLFNALLEEERAIVTPHPGTTRDTVEGWLALRGIPVSLVDCAGIREARGRIELEGVRRSVSEVESAMLILLVLDASEELRPEDEAVLTLLGNKKFILILNKTDLPQALDEVSLKGRFPDAPLVRVSSLRQEGLFLLKEAMLRLVCSGHDFSGRISQAANMRQREALRRAGSFLDSAARSAREGFTLDVVAADTRLALDVLGEITGETATDEILEAIFSRFCIGK